MEPSVDGRRNKRMPTRVRFWALVDMSAGPEGCWPWIGTKKGRQGYGEFYANSRRTLAHRMAWTLVNGPIAEGLSVCHRCDNPACCNPAHLFTGTHLDNMRDMFAKGRRAAAVGERHNSRTRPETVPMGERHFKAKLTEADVREIRARYASGETPKGLGAAFGVAGSTVNNIVARRIWKHLK